MIGTQYAAQASTPETLSVIISQTQDHLQITEGKLLQIISKITTELLEKSPDKPPTLAPGLLTTAHSIRAASSRIVDYCVMLDNML